MDKESIKINGKELNYYEFLNISIDSNLNDIKRAYRRTSLKYHPDKNPDNPVAEELFRKLTKVYDVLTDPGARQAYDNYLKTQFEKIKKRRELDRVRNQKIQELEKDEQSARRQKEQELEAKAKLDAELERLRKQSRPKQYYDFEVEEELSPSPPPTFNRELQLKQQIEQLKSQLDSQELSIGIKWKSSANIDRYTLVSIFSKYGEIEDIIISPNKSNHALISFKSVLGSYNAMIAKKRQDPELNGLEPRWLTQDQSTPKLVLDLIELMDQLSSGSQTSQPVKQSIGSHMSLDEYFSFTLMRIKKAKQSQNGSSIHV